MDDKGKPVQDSWPDSSPKTDDKGQPVYKQQDRQVAKDDLDKDKNKDAAVLGTLTAMDVWKTDNAEGHQRAVRAWAQSAWQAWAPHHEQIRRWVPARFSDGA